MSFRNALYNTIDAPKLRFATTNSSVPARYQRPVTKTIRQVAAAPA